MSEERYKRLNEINLHRLAVRVKWEGRTYQICEVKRDEYNQPLRDEKGNYVTDCTGEINGLYSTSHSYVQKQSTEEAVTRTKQNPILYCDYKSAKEKEIKINTLLLIEGIVFKVIELTDIYLLGVIGQISLEVYNGDSD